MTGERPGRQPGTFAHRSTTTPHNDMALRATSFVLPFSVLARLEAPNRPKFLNGGPTFDLASTDGGALCVAAWMHALGYNAAGVVAVLEAREAGRTERTGRPADDWADRSEYAKEMLEVGRYLTSGEVSDRPSARVRDLLTQADRPHGLGPSGLPWLASDELADYAEAVCLDYAERERSRTARTDRHVLKVAARLAVEAGTIGPALSNRTVGLMANLTRETARKSLHRLETSGYLLPIPGRLAPGEARRFVLRSPVTGPELMSLVVTGYRSLKVNHKCHDLRTLPKEHPVFHRDAFGSAGFDLLQVLVTARPTSDRDWYTLARVGRTQFYVVKSKLTGSGELPAVVAHEADGWRMVDDVDRALDVIASAYGVDRLAEARITRTESERFGHTRFRLRSYPASRMTLLADGRIWDAHLDEVVRLAQVANKAAGEQHQVFGPPRLWLSGSKVIDGPTGEIVGHLASGEELASPCPLGRRLAARPTSAETTTVVRLRPRDPAPIAEPQVQAEDREGPRCLDVAQPRKPDGGSTSKRIRRLVRWLGHTSTPTLARTA